LAYRWACTGSNQWGTGMTPENVRGGGGCVQIALQGQSFGRAAHGPLTRWSGRAGGPTPSPRASKRGVRPRRPGAAGRERGRCLWRPPGKGGRVNVTPRPYVDCDSDGPPGYEGPVASVCRPPNPVRPRFRRSRAREVRSWTAVWGRRAFFVWLEKKGGRADGRRGRENSRGLIIVKAKRDNGGASPHGQNTRGPLWAQTSDRGVVVFVCGGGFWRAPSTRGQGGGGRVVRTRGIVQCWAARPPACPSKSRSTGPGRGMGPRQWFIRPKPDGAWGKRSIGPHPGKGYQPSQGPSSLWGAGGRRLENTHVRRGPAGRGTKGPVNTEGRGTHPLGSDPRGAGAGRRFVHAGGRGGTVVRAKLGAVCKTEARKAPRRPKCVEP